MVYDRADPDRARTTKEKNENRFLVNLGYVLLVAGSLGTPFAAWAARRRPPPEIHVRYREGTGIVLRAVLSTHGAN
ncbi:MAG TPA: DUF3592 domain-containing protein, partial [Amycolatopsis sp.]|nr:DUF3592 domain-containing protein [Amycolatopsis sp.]